MKQKQRWRKGKKAYLFADSMAVYGTVSINPVKSDFGKYDVYEWCARTVMWSIPTHQMSPRGFAKTVEEAKNIVEALCTNTRSYVGMKDKATE